MKYFRLGIWLIILALSLSVIISKRMHQGYSVLNIPEQQFLEDSSHLRLGKEAAVAQYISLNLPQNFNFKTRAEVFGIRKRFVLQHRDFVQGDYSPSMQVFGQITDGKPWWGLEGELCESAGQHSIDGPAEESRFFANPFLLLAVGDYYTFEGTNPCYPVYPEPYSIYWNAKDRTAITDYIISDYFRRRPTGIAAYFDLSNYNARDFGYNYVYAVPQDSKNVSPKPMSHLFDGPIYMRAFIHTGGSCGYPGGCNNKSPNEPDMVFLIQKLPAELYCKLWKKKPQNVNAIPDFTFIINFE